MTGLVSDRLEPESLTLGPYLFNLTDAVKSAKFYQVAILRVLYSFLLFIYLLIFEACSPYVALTGLEFLVVDPVGLELTETCLLCLPSARIRDMCHTLDTRFVLKAWMLPFITGVKYFKYADAITKYGD